MKKEQICRTGVAVLLIILAVVVMFLGTSISTSTEHHAKEIQTLDDKRTQVLELTATATAASALISAIPDDTCTPIAEKLADLSSCFIIVLCAIFLEKYLLTIIGYASFGVLIPIALGLFAACVISKKRTLLFLATKIGLFALAIYFVIPVSVKISDKIEETNKQQIESTIDSAKDLSNDMTESADNENDGIWNTIVDTVKKGTTEITSKIKNVISNYIDALAVMIVTSCIIPVVVILVFIWLIKSILEINFDYSKIMKLPIWSRNRKQKKSEGEIRHV